MITCLNILKFKQSYKLFRCRNCENLPLQSTQGLPVQDDQHTSSDDESLGSSTGLSDEDLVFSSSGEEDPDEEVHAPAQNLQVADTSQFSDVSLSDDESNY